MILTTFSAVIGAVWALSEILADTICLDFFNPHCRYLLCDFDVPHVVGEPAPSKKKKKKAKEALKEPAIHCKS